VTALLILKHFPTLLLVRPIVFTSVEWPPSVRQFRDADIGDSICRPQIMIFDINLSSK